MMREVITPHIEYAVDDLPSNICNLCEKELTDIVIDGKTIWGSWAWMCELCHEIYGTGLGLGKGQIYRKS